MYRFGLIALTFCIVGCGSEAGKGRVPVYAVSGKVTLFGAPLSSATVAFAPTDGQPTAIGSTDDQGNFRLTTYEFGDGAAEGAYRVVISKATSAPTGESSTESHGANYVDTAGAAHGGGAASSGEKLVPAQYSNSKDTPLTAEVKPEGENTFTFEIK